MSTSQDTTQKRKGKAEWMPSRDVYLVDLLIDQYNLSKGSQNGFTTKQFNAITRAFNEKFNTDMEEAQIRNRHSVLKKDYGIVKSILGNTSGFGWDDVQKMVTASDDKVWEDYLAAHSEAKPFRRKGFPLYDRLSIIFGGQRATGKFQVSSAQASEEGNSNANMEQTSKLSNPSRKETTVTLDGSSSSSDSIFQIDSDKSKKRSSDAPKSSGQKKRVRLKTGDKIANAFSELATASKMRAMHKVQANDNNTLYQKCIEELQTMEELNEVDILKSVDVLKDDKNAIAFMTLKGPLRMAFLRSLWQ